MKNADSLTYRIRLLVTTTLTMMVTQLLIMTQIMHTALSVLVLSAWPRAITTVEWVWPTKQALEVQ